VTVRLVSCVLVCLSVSVCYTPVLCQKAQLRITQTMPCTIIYGIQFPDDNDRSEMNRKYKGEAAGCLPPRPTAGRHQVLRLRRRIRPVPPRSSPTRPGHIRPLYPRGVPPVRYPRGIDYPFRAPQAVRSGVVTAWLQPQFSDLDVEVEVGPPTTPASGREWSGDHSRPGVVHVSCVYHHTG